MLKRIRQTLKKKAGFSLIELLVVIAIMGVISLVAIPNVVSALNTSKYNTDRTNAAAIATAFTTAKAQGVEIDNCVTTEVTVGVAPGNKIITEYLQSAPTVKGVAGKTNFYVTITAEKVTVFAHTGTGTDSAKDYTEIFPSPSGVWEEK